MRALGLSIAWCCAGVRQCRLCRRRGSCSLTARRERRQEAQLADRMGARRDRICLCLDRRAECKPRLQCCFELRRSMDHHTLCATRVHNIVLVGTQRDLGAVGEKVDTAARGDLEERDLDGTGLPRLADASVYLAADTLQERGHCVCLASSGLAIQQSGRIAHAAEHPIEERLQHTVAHRLFRCVRWIKRIHVIPAVQHAQSTARAGKAGVMAHNLPTCSLVH
mmetsp:Transcript_7226/g.18876  ORF Transcript_7226/g.18876 Transcript_7226/m.18876 type:complete len:223 (-) Transcript_7226:433-1101(-)